MAREENKDSLKQLKAAIKAGQPQNLYIFYGEEGFLLQHYLNMLHRAILDEVTESFNYHRFNNENFDIQSFADAVENLPMMAERTMVQVDDIDLYKLPEESRSKMTEILSDIPEYCTIVLVHQTVEYKPDNRQKKLAQALSKGETVEFAKQNQRDLIVWITRHFAAKHKYISPDLCAYLIDITDGTMTMLGSEIEKIAAFSGADHICKADIDAVTEPVLDAVVFRMTDQLAAGDYAQALLTLQKLLKMQQEPLSILGAVGGHLRRLATARILTDNGSNASELVKLCAPLSEYQARKSIDAARRFSPRFFEQVAMLVMETDQKIKTSFDSPQRLLELLILQLAQEAKNG